jgi:hypothetical protein
MHDALTIYFNGEKNAGLFIAVVGAAIVAAAVALFRARADFRSFALTLGIVALVEIAIGVGLYLKTDPQVGRLRAQLDSSPSRFSADERARMARVQRNFVVIEYVEVALIVVTAMVAIARKTNPTLTGVALGLLINAALLLAFDLIAERRGAVYLAAIERGGANSSAGARASGARP